MSNLTVGLKTLVSKPGYTYCVVHWFGRVKRSSRLRELDGYTKNFTRFEPKEEKVLIEDTVNILYGNSVKIHQ